MMKRYFLMLIVFLLVFTIVQASEYGIVTYNSSEIINIYTPPVINRSSTNASPITDARCLFNLSNPDETNNITNGILTHTANGIYKNISGTFTNEGLYQGIITCNKSTWEGSVGFNFNIVDKYSYNYILDNTTQQFINLNDSLLENLTTQLDTILSNQSTMLNNITLQINNLNISILNNQTGNIITFNNSMFLNITAEFRNLNASILANQTGNILALNDSLLLNLTQQFKNLNASIMNVQTNLLAYLIDINDTVTTINLLVNSTNITLGDIQNFLIYNFECNVSNSTDYSICWYLYHIGKGEILFTSPAHYEIGSISPFTYVGQQQSGEYADVIEANETVKEQNLTMVSFSIPMMLEGVSEGITTFTSNIDAKLRRYEITALQIMLTLVIVISIIIIIWLGFK